jgi:hypothetical protein
MHQCPISIFEAPEIEAKYATKSIAKTILPPSQFPQINTSTSTSIPHQINPNATTPIPPPFLNQVPIVIL